MLRADAVIFFKFGVVVFDRFVGRSDVWMGHRVISYKLVKSYSDVAISLHKPSQTEVR